MKNWMILMGWIIVSFTASSQTLKPKVLTVNQDTNFCFTIPQSKVIAEYIVKGQFSDTLECQYEKQIQLLEERVDNDFQIKEKLKQKVFNLDTIIDNNDQSILILTDQVNRRDKKLKRSKWQKIALGTALILTSTAIILK